MRGGCKLAGFVAQVKVTRFADLFTNFPNYKCLLPNKSSEEIDPRKFYFSITSPLKASIKVKNISLDQ